MKLNQMNRKRYWRSRKMGQIFSKIVGQKNNEYYFGLFKQQLMFGKQNNLKKIEQNNLKKIEQNNLKKIEVTAEKKKSAPNPGNYQLIPPGIIHKKNQITSFYKTINAHKKPQLQLLHCLQINSKRQQSKGKQLSKRSKDIGQKKKSQDFQIQHQYTKRKTSAQNQNITKLNHLVQQSQIKNHKRHQDINKKNFKLQYIVGKGGFGKVWKIQQKKNKKLYAMKQMLKALYPLLIRIMTKKSVNSVINERILLSKIQNPFIVNMHYAFQDRQILYLVLDLMPGGDLRYHLAHQKKFTQIQTSNQFQQNFLLHVQFQDSNIYIPSTSFIEIQNQKILFLINMVISELLILVLLECLDNKIILIPVARQDIWHLKYLVSIIIPSLLIIMLQELQPISSCWEKQYFLIETLQWKNQKINSGLGCSKTSTNKNK